MSGAYRATRPHHRRPRRAHRLRCGRGWTSPVRTRAARRIAYCIPNCVPSRPPFARCRRPARRCRTACRSRAARSRPLPPQAARAAHARAAVRAPVCTPCHRIARPCEGAIHGRSGTELCLGWPAPIRYFERSRSDAVGSSQHARFPPRPRACATPACAARPHGCGTRAAAVRVVRVARTRSGRTSAAPHRASPFDPPSPTGARPPCPHFAISVTPGRPSRAPP